MGMKISKKLSVTAIVGFVTALSPMLMPVVEKITSQEIDWKIGLGVIGFLTLQQVVYVYSQGKIDIAKVLETANEVSKKK